MQKQQESPQEKKKRSGMTKYEKIKARILVFIAVVIVTQAVLSVGSFLYSTSTLDKMFPEEDYYPYCKCPATEVFYGEPYRQ